MKRSTSRTFYRNSIHENSQSFISYTFCTVAENAKMSTLFVDLTFKTQRIVNPFRPNNDYLNKSSK